MSEDKYLTYNELMRSYRACDEALDTFAKVLGRDGRLSLGKSGLIGLLMHPEGRQHIGWLLWSTPANWHLDMLDLSGVQLPQLCFRQEHVTSCKFVGTGLHRACFRRSYIDDCNFSGASLQYANFRFSHISDTSFASADLRAAYLSEADLSCCHFYKADLRGATFRQASLMGCFFGDAKLEGADFREAAGLDPDQREYLAQMGATV